MAQTFGFVLYVLGLEACVLGLGLGLGLVAYVLGLAICVLDSITGYCQCGTDKWSTLRLM